MSRLYRKYNIKIIQIIKINKINKNSRRPPRLIRPCIIQHLAGEENRKTSSDPADPIVTGSFLKIVITPPSIQIIIDANYLIPLG